MPIPPSLHSQRWLTRRSVITGQFVTPGSRLSKVLSAPWGLTPGPKFTNIGHDLLLPTQVYHTAKFHRQASTHVGDICYKIFCRQTDRQTVNNISPACPSACRDNNCNAARQDYVTAAIHQLSYTPLLILLSSAVGGDAVVTCTRSVT